MLPAADLTYVTMFFNFVLFYLSKCDHDRHLLIEHMEVQGKFKLAVQV